MKVEVVEGVQHEVITHLTCVCSIGIFEEETMQGTRELFLGTDLADWLAGWLAGCSSTE